MHPVYQSRRVICSIHMEMEFYWYMMSLTSSPTEDFSDIVSLHPPIVDFRVYRYQKLRHA